MKNYNEFINESLKVNFIEAYDNRADETYYFWVGRKIRFHKNGLNRWIEGEILSIEEPKYAANNTNEWKVNVKNLNTGNIIYAKIYEFFGPDTFNLKNVTEEELKNLTPKELNILKSKIGIDKYNL